MKKNRITFIPILFFFPLFGYGQYSTDGFAVSDTSTSWYEEKVDPNLINAVDGEYGELIRKTKGSHPFFIDGNWTVGNMIYKGKEYTNQTLVYDLDQKILFLGLLDKTSWKVVPVKLSQSEVSLFSIHGWDFKYMETESSFVPDGFFQVIHEGEGISMYAWRKKVFRIESATTSSYEEEITYFIKTDNQYQLYLRRGSLLKLFPDHKKQIRKFIRANKLKTTKGNDYHLARLIEFCDTL